MDSARLINIKLGDAEMSYVQYVIQARNSKLFEAIMQTDNGFDDFVNSRDIHENNAMHYIALMDDEEFLEVIINKVNW